MNKETEKKIEDVLGSLDRAERAGSNPYLFTRVKAALDERKKSLWDSVFMLLTRPVAVAGLLGLIILMNLLAFFSTSTNKNTNVNDDTYLSEDYSVTTPSATIYEFENLEDK